MQQPRRQLRGRGLDKCLLYSLTLVLTEQNGQRRGKGVEKVPTVYIVYALPHTIMSMTNFKQIFVNRPSVQWACKIVVQFPVSQIISTLLSSFTIYLGMLNKY